MVNVGFSVMNGWVGGEEAFDTLKPLSAKAVISSCYLFGLSKNVTCRLARW